MRSFARRSRSSSRLSAGASSRNVVHIYSRPSKQGGRARASSVCCRCRCGKAGTEPGRYPTRRRLVLCVVLTFSEWPINFVYPPACIINARLLPRENPSGAPAHPARPLARQTDRTNERTTDRPSDRRASPRSPAARGRATADAVFVQIATISFLIKIDFKQPYIINYPTTPRPRLGSCKSTHT